MKLEPDTITAICSVIIASLSLLYTVYTSKKQSTVNQTNLELANASLEVAKTVAEKEQFFRDVDAQPNLVFTTARYKDDSDRNFVGFQIENRGPGHARIFPPIINLENKNKMIVCGVMKNPPYKHIEFWNVHNAIIFPPNEKKKVMWVEDHIYESLSEEERSVLLGSWIICMYTDLMGNEYFTSGYNGNGMLGITQEMASFLGQEFAKNRKFLGDVDEMNAKLGTLGRKTDQ